MIFDADLPIWGNLVAFCHFANLSKNQGILSRNADLLASHISELACDGYVHLESFVSGPGHMAAEITLKMDTRMGV